MSTKVRIYLSPFDNPMSEVILDKPSKIIDLIPDDGTREVFSDGGIVRSNGNIVPKAWWPHVTIKPAADNYVDFIYVPGSKKTFLLLAAIALVAVTGFVGAGGVAAVLGLGATSTFAAGGLGASLLAAGIGVAGSLALTALSAPPKFSNESKERSLAQAGVSGNAITMLEPLPYIAGVIGFSAPLLAPPYTEWDGERVIAYAAIGAEGRCAIDNIKINGIPIEDFSNAEHEVREGLAVDEPRTMFTQTVIEERDGITISNFLTELEANSNDLLTNQDDPTKSIPVWHTFRTAGSWDKVVLRFLFPSGIVYSYSGDRAFMPMRIEIRKVGSATWRRLPTFHFFDVNVGHGSMRAEISLERIKQPAGRHFSYADGQYPIFDACNRTGYGTSFEYASDSYFDTPLTNGANFQVPAGQAIPLRTGYTGGGVTVSASSEFSTSFRAWYACDDYLTGGGTYWRPANNSLPAWWRAQFSSAKTFRSYSVWCSDGVGEFPTYGPTKWMPQGSNDGTNWVDLDDADVDISTLPKRYVHCQIGNPGSYLYYRILFKANNGAASQQLQVAFINFFEFDALGSSWADAYPNTELYPGSGGSLSYWNATGITSNAYRCKYVSLNKKGARVFLDPDQWEAGEYEIRVMRGAAGYYAYYASAATFGLATPYRYADVETDADYFEYRGTAGSYEIYIGQKNYRSETTVEVFQTISSDLPFDDTGIAMVAVAVPNVSISSLYARFSKYAREWDGTMWSNTYTLTSNPAAHYRELLLGASNVAEISGESIDEAGLAAWFERCEAEGYEVNAVLQGGVVGDAKQMIATCGYAAPSDGEVYGVVEDRDTSADPVMYMITPQNSKDEGNVNDIPDLPHAIRAEFSDASQTYAIEHRIIYREGYTEENATLFDTINYSGFTDAAKVDARAQFDLDQKYARRAIYTRRCGRSALGIKRGDVVGLVDPTIDGDKSFGWIQSIQTSGSDVTGITIENLAKWSVSGDLGSVDDLEGLSDLDSISTEMAVAVRILGSEILIKKVTNTSDSTTCTFQTPFPLAGSGLEEGLMVVAGKYATITRRCRVLYVIPDGFEERILVLVDEAPELFA